MSNTIYKIDMQADPPAMVGSISSPVTVIHATFDPDADNGNGGLWVGSWSTDLVLLSLTGTELARITSETHELVSTISTALEVNNPQGRFLWALDTEANHPILKQIGLPGGAQTGQAYDFVTEGHATVDDLSGGMFIM